MLRRFQIRHLLLFAMALLTAVALMALAWNAYWTTTSLRKSQWIEQVSRASEAALDVSVHAAIERGLSVAVLTNPTEPLDELRAVLGRERLQVDAGQDALVQAVHALSAMTDADMAQKALEQLQLQRLRVNEVRASLDDVLAQGYSTLTEATQIQIFTEYIDAAAGVRRVVMMPMHEDDHADISNMLIKEIMFTAIEHAGRERALLTAIIASAESPTEAQLKQLARDRYVVEAALGKADATLNGFPQIPAIVEARRKVTEEFLERYERLRQRVYQAGAAAQEYPLTNVDWFLQSTAAINTLVDLSRAIDAHIQDDVRNALDQAGRQQQILLLSLILAIATVVFAVFVILHRAIGPLQVLTAAANVLADGDLGRAMPEFNSDEIGDVARAMERMRRTLLSDVEERKSIYARLSASEARYRAIFESLQDVYFRTTLDGYFVTVSPSVTALLGYAPDELMHMPVAELYDDASDRPRLLQSLQEKGSVHDYELKVRRKNGDVIPVSMTARLLSDAAGAIGLEGVVRDITLRKQSEDEMRKMKLVVEQTADVVIITDRSGVIEYVNNAFEDVTGYRREEVVGRPVNLLRSGHQGRDFYRAMWQTLERGDVFHGLLVNRKKNGELYDEEKTISPVRDADGTIIHYVSTGKNVTAKRQMQAQMQQSEKLASIGQLAAGVAHEINNPVGYINSNIGSLGQYVDDLFELLAAYEEAEGAITDSAVVEHLYGLRKRVDIDFLKDDIRSLVTESQEGVKRVKQIVQDLKDFSRTDSTEYDWADLHQGLNSTLNIVHNELKYKADVVKEFGQLPLVECVASQLNQVFMNLLVNAAHAIDERGTITIRTGTEGGDWVWVEVEDSGKGIPPENMRHIFEPFFTTKPVGKGTGLGLSLSYGIVQKHGGHIDVQSEVGKGTRFRVVLPVHRPVVAPSGTAQVSR